MKYLIHSLMACAPVAWLFDGINIWFLNNQQFFKAICIAIFLNIVVGGYFHLKQKTFSWELFIKRNSLMILVLIIVYTLLEQLRVTAGENWAGETFKILIQVASLLYPTSKVLKNIYILSNKQHPPAFIMEKLYNFEKTGNLTELFKEKNESHDYDNTSDSEVR